MTTMDANGLLTGIAMLGTTAVAIALLAPEVGLYVARQLRAHSVATLAARQAYRETRAADLCEQAGHTEGVQLGHTERKGGGEPMNMGLQILRPIPGAGVKTPAAALEDPNLEG